MTDLDLQKAIVAELERLIKKNSIKVPPADGETNWVPINVYRQEKPWKSDEDSEDQENYILVMIDDEDQNDDGEWVVTIHCLFSIHFEDMEHQGNLVLADIMNQVYEDLRKKTILEGKYELQMNGAHKRFNQECYPNYYESDLITQWKLPETLTEGVNELV